MCPLQHDYDQPSRNTVVIISLTTITIMMNKYYNNNNNEYEVMVTEIMKIFPISLFSIYIF